MYWLFDFGQTGVSATLEEVAPLLRKHHIRGVNVPAELLGDEGAALRAARCIADEGLRWGLLPTPVDSFSEDVDDGAFDVAMETLKRRCAIGEKMGVRYAYNHIWSGSNSREYEANYEWIVRRARRIWKVMDDYGIQYGLEFLGPHTLQASFRYPFFNNLSGALAVADAISPRCGFVFDTFHWFCGSNSNPGDLLLACQQVHRMVNFHIDDGMPGRSWLEQMDLERAMPLENGVIDAATPYRLFREAGYRGPVMCEPMDLWVNAMRGKPVAEVIGALAAAYERVDQAAREAE